ncbi:hypothetical protein HMPREF3119_18380 [Morganella sp. HMSC11D09]|uniref:hypothetical protein n=1 Tax=Morganella sp. HMSC11D09 TaxID=1581087 RepID=UPI0008A10F3B|nr:hypothetical protein [Morganella sp. HMSC11D09]OFU95676.1 hypothetical protein HMPREF3119_18380 [Morganella sp. HMSC11D09]HEI8511807.1 hypothetical protein [Morganella morganii]
MKFEELSLESQDAARQVLSDMLKMKYHNTHDLPDGTVKYLGKRIVEAFYNLENEKPEMGACDSHCDEGKASTEN